MVTRTEIIRIHQDAIEFFGNFQLVLSKDQSAYLMEGTQPRVIPEIKLFIKDHKKLDPSGIYPM
eukprot:9546175-Ditylum_brightwellii.AAC.1